MDGTQFSPLAPEHASGLADDIALSRVPPQYKQMVIQASQQYGVPIHVLGNVMKMESNGDPNATSKAGAMGLMQLMPSTFQGLGGSGNPYDPQQNIALGTKYLSQLLSKYGNNEQMALAAYDWGPGNLSKRGLQNAPSETMSYLSKYGQLMGSEMPPSNGTSFAGLLSQGNQGNLPQQMVNANQPQRDSSIGAQNPFLSQPALHGGQDDFPRQSSMENTDSNDDSIESLLGINKLF